MFETTNQFKFQVKLEGSQCTFQTCKIHSHVFTMIQSITELDDWMNMIKQRKLNMRRIFHLFNGKYLCSACAARAKSTDSMRFPSLPQRLRRVSGSADRLSHLVVGTEIIPKPSGKRLHNYGKIHHFVHG